MLKNYLLLAIKIMQRRKFYTFVSLLGISLTLMVLIVVTSLVENFVHPKGPERNSDRFLVAGNISIELKTDGRLRSRYNGGLGYHFAEGVRQMSTPETVSVFSGSVADGSGEVIGFRDGVRISSAHKRTDANYWKILQFDFLEGRPISEAEHQQGTYVAVISETTRGQYFPGENATGKTLVLNGNSFQVIGVVKDVSPLQTFAVADIWTPIFAATSTQFRHEDRGQFMVLMQGNSAKDIPAMREEYRVFAQNYQAIRPASWSTGDVTVSSYAHTKTEFYTRRFYLRTGIGAAPPEGENISGSFQLTILGTGMLLFMLLPVINMVNINVSRIMDRASEIGVRKSFGASSAHLVWQFVTENLVITVLGGALGFVLAKVALYWAEAAGVMTDDAVQFNGLVLVLGLFYILVFGLLSAVYPAWRMSHMDPVQALKGALS